MKKMLALIMTLSVFFWGGVINPIIAYATENTIVVESESYQEITDPYELLELAILQQSVATMSTRSVSSGCEGDIVATQLLERKVYANGNEECLYATTGFLVLDENNEKISTEQLLSSNTVEYNGNTTASNGKYNLAVSCTAYWTWMSDDTGTYARCTHTTNQVVGNTTGDYYVTQLDCVFRATNDGWTEPLYIDHVYIDYPSPYVMYTAVNPRTDFFRDNRYFGEIVAGVVIHYNDGETEEVYIDVKAAAGN